MSDLQQQQQQQQPPNAHQSRQSQQQQIQQQQLTNAANQLYNQQLPNKVHQSRPSRPPQQEHYNQNQQQQKKQQQQQQNYYHHQPQQILQQNHLKRQQQSDLFQSRYAQPQFPHEQVLQNLQQPELIRMQQSACEESTVTTQAQKIISQDENVQKQSNNDEYLLVSTKRYENKKGNKKREDDCVEAEGEHCQLKQPSWYSKNMNPQLPLLENALAHTMKVDSIIINIGEKSNEKPSTVPINNSIVDLASTVCSNWNKQVNALALAPADQLEFYKRQLEQLVNVLSISLFNKLPNINTPQSQSQTNCNAFVNSANKTDNQLLLEQDNVLQQKKQTRKRNASQNNDYEIIIFEHGKRNRYLFRRVESVEKYAKRMKIPRYIRIVVRNEDTKGLIASLRTADPKFVVGKEIHYEKGESLQELYNEIKRRIKEMSLENDPDIEFIEEENNAVTGAHVNEEEADVCETQEPPLKKIKSVRAKKQTSRSVINKNTDRRTLIAENTRPSGVEMDTDVEDEYNDNKEVKTNKNVNSSESDNSTSDSSSDDSSSSGDENNDNEKQTELQLPVATETYIPISKTDQSLPRYVPTPKAPVAVNKLYHYDSPPSPFLTEVDRKQENSLSPLFPDSQGLNKKKKHR